MYAAKRQGKGGLITFPARRDRSVLK
jgi:hypothetical protein